MAKKKISPENNWGDVMAELQAAKAVGVSQEHLLFIWTAADLNALLADPMDQAAYLRDLCSVDPKVRKKMIKLAAKFRKQAKEVLDFIYGNEMTDEQKDRLVYRCELGANGLLSSLLAGVDHMVLCEIEEKSRQLYAKHLLGLEAS